MNLHYLKMARRAIRRHPGFSLINVLGLSVGIAACLLIYGYVSDELSYDAYHPKADRIARVTAVLHSPESDLALATSPVQLAGWLLHDCPELEGATRIQPATFVIRKASGEVLAAKDFCYSEQSVFDLFFFSFVEGGAVGALAAPNSIVLTRSAAMQYLGPGPALGKVLICNNTPCRVTAVIADRPANSDIPINALVTKDYTAITYLSDDDFELYTFLLFRKEMDLRRFNARLPGLIGPHMQPELDKAALKEYTFKFEAEALADVHFSKGKLEDTPKGNRAFNNVFSVLAGFILFIAPMIMIYRTDPPLVVMVKAPPGEVSRLGQLWKRYIPSQPFNHYFLDEDFEAQYKKDRMTFLLFDVFAGLAILISCLGLYGLVSLITLQRTKEIGIRKVLGASLSQLVALLSKDLLWLVGWSALIALPLAAMGAYRWLSSYAYHTTMTVWMFALPVVVILLLALAVTGYRILRTALVNPVEHLRSE